MGTKDKRVDAYIERSAPFAGPILRHLRSLVHQACPNVQETIKWGFPHFEYKGILCSMASFKNHCAFGFWKASAMSDPHGILSTVGKTAMGHLGQIRALADLPPDARLKEYITEAANLNENGVPLPKRIKVTEKKTLKIPPYFRSALRRNKKALQTFENFSNSHKKEYVEWVTEAKGEDTRMRRLATAIAWMAEGKGRNWKYVRR